MTNDTAATTERTWTQDHSGDWLTDGAHGRRYRYHPLGGLKCFDPRIGFEYGVAVTPMGTIDGDDIEAAVERHEAEKAAADERRAANRRVLMGE